MKSVLFLFLAATIVASARQTENIIFVMTDGLRWQEVFNGAEADLMDRTNGGVADVANLKEEFWRDLPDERRAALMPFVWKVMAQQARSQGASGRSGAARSC